MIHLPCHAPCCSHHETFVHGPANEMRIMCIKCHGQDEDDDVSFFLSSRRTSDSLVTLTMSPLPSSLPHVRADVVFLVQTVTSILLNALVFHRPQDRARVFMGGLQVGVVCYFVASIMFGERSSEHDMLKAFSCSLMCGLISEVRRDMMVGWDGEITESR